MKKKYIILWALACAVFLGMAFVTSGCRSVPRRSVPEIVVPPVNPDMAPVREPVKSAKASAGKAQSSAERAAVIVEKIIPSAGQEDQIKTLKLELATTVEELRIAGEKLDLALLQIPQLEKDISTLMQRWKVENTRADTAVLAAAKERARADKEHGKAIKAGRERDAFVLLFALSGVVAVLTVAKDPIRTIQNPWLQLLAWAGVAVGSFLACFWAIRLLVAFLVEITL